MHKKKIPDDGKRVHISDEVTILPIDRGGRTQKNKKKHPSQDHQRSTRES